MWSKAIVAALLIVSAGCTSQPPESRVFLAPLGDQVYAVRVVAATEQEAAVEFEKQAALVCSSGFAAEDRTEFVVICADCRSSGPPRHGVRADITCNGMTS